MGAAFVILSACVAVYLLFRYVPVPLETPHQEAGRKDEEPYERWLA